jgi:hypothetical protein
MKRPNVIVFPLRRPAVHPFSYWQNDMSIDRPRAIRSHAPGITVLPSNVIVMPNGVPATTAARDL